jgi:hypothetical protein
LFSSDRKKLGIKNDVALVKESVEIRGDTGGTSVQQLVTTRWTRR